MKLGFKFTEVITSFRRCNYWQQRSELRVQPQESSSQQTILCQSYQTHSKPFGPTIRSFATQWQFADRNSVHEVFELIRVAFIHQNYFCIEPCLNEFFVQCIALGYNYMVKKFTISIILPLFLSYTSKVRCISISNLLSSVSDISFIMPESPRLSRINNTKIISNTF